MPLSVVPVCVEGGGGYNDLMQCKGNNNIVTVYTSQRHRIQIPGTTYTCTLWSCRLSEFLSALSVSSVVCLWMRLSVSSWRRDSVSARLGERVVDN